MQWSRYMVGNNVGSWKRVPERKRGLTCNRLLKLNHYNHCYIYDFFFYFYYCGTVCNSKSQYFFVLFSKQHISKEWEIYIFFKLNKTDTSLYFLTLKKVEVSLPTKCLSDPTSGSVLIGDYRLGHAPFPGFAYIKRILKKNGNHR